MNDKDVPKKSSDQDSNDSDWKFCPICGIKFPNIQNLKFCTVCGTDIKYIKENKELRPRSTSNPYKSPTQYSQYESPPIFYKPELISDDKLIDNKDHKLWGALVSIGIPLAALLVMSGIAGAFLSFILIISRDITILNNSYLTSISSLFSFIFIIVPVFYVRKYLKNPTLKNRLILLGFTTRGFDKKRIFKEVLIGLGFALIGVFIVIGTTVLIELILELALNINITHDNTGLTGEIIPPDLPSLIVFSVIVILAVGTSEEILFRGFMQKGLVRSLGERWGILVTALIFSMIHLVGIFLSFFELQPFVFIVLFILSFTPYFAISLVLGLLYHWRKENLIAVVITHGVYDVLVIVISFLLFGLL
ncbi:MAG: CPBP family glutamic-type intramembrane protease [Promethearchaeota archaeon]|jgi:membrane protease YdiL (CAAX protease family)